MKSKTPWLDRSLISGPYLALCLTEAQFRAKCREMGVDDSGPFLSSGTAARAHCFKKVGAAPAVLVCIRKKRRSAVDLIGLLAHEATHVWQWFCEHIGEDEPSKEFEAYAIEVLTKRLLIAYRTQKE